MDGLRFSRATVEAIIDHARTERPLECCGILTGKGATVHRAIPTTNVDQSPVKYTIAPAEMAKAFLDADKAGQDVLGFYHSHTATEAYPSVTDAKLAPPSDLFDYQYVIVSLEEPDKPVIRSFRIVDKQVLETTLEIS